MPERTISGWQEDEGVQAYVLVEGQVILWLRELWFDAREDAVELARIIVDPQVRGTGLGRELVRALLARAVEAGFDDVFMRVHPDNDRALRCYLGAGFVLVELGLADSWNSAQPVNYVWLRNALAGAGDEGHVVQPAPRLVYSSTSGRTPTFSSRRPLASYQDAVQGPTPMTVVSAWRILGLGSFDGSALAIAGNSPTCQREA